MVITSFVSAFLGFFRDRMLAARFGAGNELDIYYTAFRIPDFVNMVLIIGAISAAIIPIFSQHLVRSKEEAFRFLSNLTNIFLFFLIIITIALIIFSSQILSLIAPGFASEKKEMTLLLTRVMFFSPLLLGLSSIFSSVLRVFQRFLITSLAPILYNLGIILGILFFVPFFGLLGLAFGVVLGGFLHLLVQLPVLLKLGFRPKKTFNLNEPGLKEVIKLAIPRSIGLATKQINLIVITALASTLAAGSIAVFSLAENLSRPLYTLLAVSLSTAAFPSLSLAFSKKDTARFNRLFSLTFNKIIFLTLPFGLLLFLFRNFIVEIILQSGKLSLIDANLVSACFGLFSLGIFAEGLILLLAKSFYAVRDTKTPTLLSVGGAILTLILAFLFIKLLSFSNSFQYFLVNSLDIENLKAVPVLALPLAISLSAVIQFLTLLFLFLRKRNKIFTA